MFEIVTKALITDVKTPYDYPKCVCGSSFKLQDYSNRKGVHQLTSATCRKCQQSFCVYDVQNGYEAIPRGQKARLNEDNNG